MTEIERKFLVVSEAYRSEAFRKTRIVQGFLSTHPERTVRIRIRGSKGYITVKGKSNMAGITRFEWEKEIPLSEAEILLTLCEPGVIEKTRYEVRSGAHIVEVDEFMGANAGLILAEVELNSEKESFLKPVWLGAEVTGDPRYFNASLSKAPFNTWC